MKTENLGVITSIKNQSDGLITKHTFVTSSGVLVNSEEDNNLALGVCITDTDANEQMPICVTGIVLVKSGGAINQGAKVSCDGTSVYQITFTDPPTASEMQKVVAEALDSASAADELIRVLLK